MSESDQTSNELDVTGEGTEETNETDSTDITNTSDGKEGADASGTEETSVTETSETSGSTQDLSETQSTFPTSSSRPSQTSLDPHLLPADILGLEERHIRAEDFQWGISPVPTLAEIIVESACDIEGPDLENFLTHADEKQRPRIYDKLSLDLPLSITLPRIEEGIYWKRMCLKSWQQSDIWRYSDNWKSMFVHRTVQNMIENFVPDQFDAEEFTENLKMFSDYLSSLRIQKLAKVKEPEISIDLSCEDFDELLDDLITAPPFAIYVDFERIFECFPHLHELIVMIYPKYLDYESFHFTILDFNCFFRGLGKLKELQKFRLSNGNATNEQIAIILRTFLEHDSLSEIDLSYNFIDDDVCDYIGKLLLSECPLKSLVLRNNKIMNDGVKSIAAALVENSKLEKLDLSLNVIENEGACFLAKVLLTNSTLVDLDVSKNKMLSGAGIAFSNVIRKSESLRSLKIQENCLGDNAGKMFTAAMEENTNILELDVHFCGFSFNDEGSIHQAVIKNRKDVKYSSYVDMGMNIAAAEFLF